MTVLIFEPKKYVNYLSKIHLFMKIIPHERTQRADPSEARVSASVDKNANKIPKLSKLIKT